jgi:hypothetical protein
MDKSQRCADPRLRLLILFLLAVAVLSAAFFLYVGLGLQARFLYALALLLLLLFALAGAIAIALLIYALFQRWCELRGKPPKGQGTREDSGPPSVHLPPTIYKRPDPLIYSQYYLMAQGFAVTWDNPDIWLTELPAPDGTMAPVSSSALQPNHVYRIHAQIWNGSTEAPAVGLPVFFSFLTFGIATVSTPIGVRLVDLPVKGAAGHPVEVWHDWQTPPAGHYCLQVGLFWPDDLNPANNLGQENVDVKTLNSPKAEFRFPLRNDAPIRRRFRLEADVYPPPVPPRCPEPTEGRGREAAVRLAAERRDGLTAHRREAHPLPAGWSVTFAPAADLVLGAGEEVEITATVLVPDHLPTPRPINVNAYADGALAGGVTLYVQS